MKLFHCSLEVVKINVKIVKNICGTKSYKYILPYMSENIKDVDKLYDIGGYTPIGLLTSNVNAKEYIFATTNIITYRFYKTLFSKNINYNEYINTVSKLYLFTHNIIEEMNELSLRLVKEFDSLYKQNDFSDDIIYMYPLIEYISKLHTSSYIDGRKIEYNSYKKYSNRKIYRTLTSEVVSNIYKELTKMKELVLFSNKKIDIVYYQKKELLYNDIIDKIRNKENIGLYSIFENEIQNELFGAEPKRTRRLFSKNSLAYLYKICSEYNIQFVGAMVYKIYKTYHSELEDFIITNNLKFKMYKSLHNNGEICVFGNKMNGNVYIKN